MTNDINTLVDQLATHRQELRPLVAKQIELKKLKSTLTSTKEMSEVQCNIALRRKMINQHHESIEAIRVVLRKIPRGKKGLELIAGELSTGLDKVKSAYSEITSVQWKLKKKLNTEKFPSIALLAEAQMEKARNKTTIKTLSEERKRFKDNYKIVSDKLYEIKQAA
jgi:hypothetical protein